jgi:ubiquinol-cytochrome c reductase cytochrome c subunit
MSMTDDDALEADLGFDPVVSDNELARASATPRTPRRPHRLLRRAPAAATTAAGGTGHGSRRRGTRVRRKVTSAAVLVGALFAVGGGYALMAPSSGADQTSMSASDVEQGRQLFETSCITCHGANLQGVQGRGPSLIGVGEAATYFQVSTGRMPATAQGAYEPRKPAKFDELQTQQIAAYVGSVGGGPAIPQGNLRGDPSNISQGGELFRLNCASCHNFAGKGAPLSAGKVAPSLNDATDKQIYTAMLSGPENMPVFSDNQITPDQKKAIVNYILTLRESKDPGGLSLDRIGPVSEGLLIWTVGLGALMVVILWIGRKS